MKTVRKHISSHVLILLSAAFLFCACSGSSGDDETDGDTDGSESEQQTDGDEELSDSEAEIELSGEEDDEQEAAGEDRESEDEQIPEKFRVAFLADTHIIDEFYEGPESNELDTRTMFETYDNLVAVRDHINAMNPPIDSVYIAGDIVHNYPSEDWDFYFENTTRFDIAAEILAGFDMPVHILLGNHDYDIGDIPVDFTHNLFREKFGLEETYYEVERYGFKFIMLDNFLGSTCDPESPKYSSELGSLGEAQFSWLKERLAEGKPSFVLNHNPVLVMTNNDVEGQGLKSVIEENLDVVQLWLSGHTHIWMNWKDVLEIPHIVLGSTRYDRDNYMIVEIDTVEKNFRIVNDSKLNWGTRNAEPWNGEE